MALQLLRPAGRAVLVGDPQQLPPTVLSRAAAARHLSQSLFARLQRVNALETCLCKCCTVHPCSSITPAHARLWKSVLKSGPESTDK